jgi:hypothetical protein
MKRKDYDNAKACLMKGWQKLSSGSDENYDYEKQNIYILIAFAYYSTFPY